MKLSSWISVTDRLPEKATFCCVCRGDTEAWVCGFYALGQFMAFIPEPDPDSMDLVGEYRSDITHWFDPATVPIDSENEGWINTVDALPQGNMPVLMRNNGFTIEGRFVDGEFRNKHGIHYLNPSQWKPLDSLQVILQDECDRREAENAP